MPKKEEFGEDFQYIVRIANKDLDGTKTVELGLSNIEGIGLRLARMIRKRFKIPSNKRIGELSEPQIEELKNFIESKSFEGIPEWALNHRKEITTGQNLNLVTNDLKLQIQDDINLLKKIKSYRGVRHETHHKVRGQRTKSNGRKGLSIGVMRKRS